MKYVVYLYLIISLVFSTTLFAAEAKKNNEPIVLQVVEVPIVVNGQAASIYRFKQPDGTIGLSANKGDELSVIVENKTKEPTSIHWHGIILPSREDGVPYVTQKPIMPGKKYPYHFRLVQAGTYWIHSHFRLQEQKLLAAPFIIHDPKEKPADQEIVMFLEDFSFTDPKVIYKNLRCKNTTKKPSMNMNMYNTAKDKSAQPSGMQMANSMQMNKQAMDLNDVQYDAFLANEKNLRNPDVFQITPGTTVRLRVINGSASTNFYVNTGNLPARVIAVDGENIKPITVNPFQLGIGQRVDFLLQIPNAEQSYAILAQGEGSTMQTGIILKTRNAKLPNLPNDAATATKGFDYEQEKSLQALAPLSAKKPTRTITLDLEGDMQNYVWKINNEVWPYINPVKVKAGDRVEFVFNNKTSMSHPMHLHGHVFQITAINEQSFNGANRDTILVLPKSTVKLQFDANNTGVWMLHCHNLYHSAAGMMTKMLYYGYNAPQFTLEEQASMSGSLLFRNAKECAMPMKQ